MELRSLQSPTVTSIPKLNRSGGFIEKPFLCGQVLRLPSSRRCPDSRKLTVLEFRAQATGTTKFSFSTIGAIQDKADLKDEDLAFVAGATGRVGSRTVRELLKLGFRVRAGVRTAQKAEALIQSVKQMKLDVESASEGTQPVEKLEIVECDLEKRDQIGPALGNASVVICCIGASEKEVFDITGPYRIDYMATKNLIDAATVAKVNHFILLTSLGTNKVGFPAAILNLFWGVLIWKRKAEEALFASGLPYTIVRPGGMERPTDAYKETHNITLSQEDTLFGGQVSNLQVAELIAFMAKNRGSSYCKVVEVIAETTAPLTPFGELLAKIPSQRVDVSPKESDAADGPAPVPVVSGPPPSTPIEKGPPQGKATAMSPLSPYIVYEDLKPPTSPTPTPSTSSSTARAPDVDGIPAEPKSIPSVLEPSSTVLAKEAIQEEAKKTRPLSPYIVYDDLKPPTSPSPSAPTVSLPSTLPVEGGSKIDSISGNNTAQPPAADIPKDEQHHVQAKPRPLSPFTMYEDLKPPTSPSPSQC